MAIKNGARKRIWNSPSIMWIRDFRFFTIIPAAEKDLFGRSSYYQVPNRFIKSLKLTSLRIIPWPDHCHLVLLWRVRRHALGRVWRLYNLSKDEKVALVNFFIFLHGKLWLVEIVQSILWKIHLFHRIVWLPRIKKAKRPPDHFTRGLQDINYSQK